MSIGPFQTCVMPGCNNPLKRGAVKYCSLQCVHAAQKKFRRKCLNDCGDAAKLPRSSYCSISCAHAYHYKSRAESFIAGGGIYGYVMPQFLARVLRDYYGERCLRCGWSQRHPKTGKVPIEVEHIDGDWQNSRLTNLTLLCPNCHALTLTYRGLNRGRGRAYRLKGVDRTTPKCSEHVAPSSVAKKVGSAAARQLELLTPT